MSRIKNTTRELCRTAKRQWTATQTVRTYYWPWARGALFYTTRKLERSAKFVFGGLTYRRRVRLSLLGVATVLMQTGNEVDGEEYLIKAHNVNNTNPVVFNQMVDYKFAQKSYD